ncbi:MAG: amino acid ABC transporter permease [Clostridiales bacterium]|nr:amino acid ABC transporter permease [Clostridiales bacterium]
MNFRFDWAFEWKVFRICLQYVPLCIFVAAVSVCIGLFFGILLAVAKRSKYCVMNILADIYVHLVRGIPQILLLMIIYLVIKTNFNNLAKYYNWGVNASVISPILIAIIALSLTASAYLSGTVSTALNSVGDGQQDAALACGMDSFTSFYRIILPQAIPVAMPLIGNQFITMIRATSLIGYIGVVDIVAAGKIASTISSNILEAYVAETLIYWGLTFLLETVFSFLTNKIRWSYKGEMAS